MSLRTQGVMISAMHTLPSSDAQLKDLTVSDYVFIEVVASAIKNHYRL